MTSLTFAPNEMQEMTPATLGVRGQTYHDGRLMRAYTLELDGEIGRSVAPADEIDRLLRDRPDSWLINDSQLVAAKNGVALGAVELVPLFAPAR